MKTSLFRKACATLVIVVGPMIGGCTGQDTNAAAPSAAATNVGAPTPASVAANSTTEVVAAPSVPPPSAPEVPFAVDRPLPDNIRPGTPLAEVVKLAQAGVDQEVLLAFVNNSSNGFGVGADEIIYLNDIGITKPVVTAMMERDKALKVTWTPPQPAPAAAVAVAPAAAANAIVAVADAAPEPTTVVTGADFDQALSPYGTWIEVEDYGRCWQPSVVVINHDWRPYCDRGRWVYSDCGWYWVSDYSWGWAAFHYGRWFDHPRWGWCWLPGDTWSPGWVTWRYDNAYCGWAPLPPAACYSTTAGFTYRGGSVGFGFSFGLNAGCYTFVPWGRFCNYRPREHCLPATHVARVYNNTTVINNIVVGNNNTIINRGIPVERVASLSRSEVRTYAVRDRSANARNFRSERIAEDGRSLIVNRPRVEAASANGIVHDRRSETRGGRVVSGSTSLVASPHQIGAPNSVASQVLEHADSERGTPRGRNQQTAGGTPYHVIRGGEANSQSTHTVNSPSVSTTESSTPQPSTPIYSTRPAPQPAPRNGSLVVIGQGQGRATPSHSGSYSVYSSPRTETRERSAQVETPRVSAPAVNPPQEASAPVNHNYSAPSAPVSPRSEVVRVSRGIEDRPAGRPSYSVPTPSGPSPSASSYSQPSAPSHSYSREETASSRGSYQSTPAPSAPHYSPPPAQPAPSRSEPAQQPSRSSESRSSSSSSRSDSDKRGQPR